jgi:hypothetical protein
MANISVMVTIVSAVMHVTPPGWHLEYEVKNTGQASIWLVVDESLVLRRDGGHIELSYARAKMVPGVKVFGYFDPQVVELRPGESLRRSVDITWPCRLNDIFNVEREAAPPPGEYQVSLRVGFGTTPGPGAPKLGEGVEAPVLRWQQEAVSPPVRLRIPQYSPSP